MIDMTEKYVESLNGRTCYWISRPKSGGAARCLVFLHGMTADHTLFEKQLEFFSADFTVLAWDAPAHGRSRPYRDPAYANAVGELERILAAENITRAVFIGQSMGGFHTQSFLTRHPETVEGFVGIDTCPYGEGYYSRSDRWWLRQVGWMSRLFPLRILKRSIAKAAAVTGYARKNMLRALAPYGKEELCRLMGLGFAGFLEENRDLRITCPVVLIAGERGGIGKARQYNRAWHEHTGFPLYWVKQAGHNANCDNPVEVNRIIAEFIAGL